MLANKWSTKKAGIWKITYFLTSYSFIILLIPVRFINNFVYKFQIKEQKFKFIIQKN